MTTTTHTRTEILFHWAAKTIDAATADSGAVAVIAMIGGEPEVFADPDMDEQAVIDALTAAASALTSRRDDLAEWQWPA